MPEPFGIAVFGCGGVSNGHFSAYATNPKARLVAAGIAIIGLEPVKEPVRAWTEDTPAGRASFEAFPGTGQVRPDTAIALLHELGYRGALAPEHLPAVFGERKNEIAMAWAAGYCHAALAKLV